MIVQIALVGRILVLQNNPIFKTQTHKGTLEMTRVYSISLPLQSKHVYCLRNHRESFIHVDDIEPLVGEKWIAASTSIVMWIVGCSRVGCSEELVVQDLVV